MLILTEEIMLEVSPSPFMLWRETTQEGNAVRKRDSRFSSFYCVPGPVPQAHGYTSELLVSAGLCVHVGIR